MSLTRESFHKQQINKENVQLLQEKNIFVMLKS